MSEGWHERVAKQAGVKVPEVESVLARRRIRSRLGTSPARRLRVTSIAFTGEKQGKATGSIDFSWSGLGDGVWAIASEGTNLVGKSTVLEVMIWALRGEPKGLQDDVQKWLDHVRVEFKLDDRHHVVDFAVLRGIPEGTLSRTRPDETLETLDSFSSHKGFAAAMSRFMMEALDLEPIPYQHGKDERAKVAQHGWTALSGGLYFWGEHKLLLGDTEFGGLPGRVLQLYVGLPWASTVMQASTAQKDLATEGLKSAAVRKTAVQEAEASRKRIEGELEIARGKLPKLGGEVDFARQVDELADAVATTTSAYSELDRRLAEAEDEMRGLVAAADADEREARNIRETFVATSFFNGLQPTCCPRCEAAIGKERVKKEQSDFSCSVCTEPIPSEKMENVNERLAEAEDRAAATKAAAGRAESVVSELKADLKDARSEMQTARSKLGNFPSSSSFRDRRDAELEIAKLEGMLKAIEEGAENPIEQTDKPIVDAALSIAKEEMDAAAENLLNELSEEILQLAQRFGFTSLEWVKLDPQAHMALGKGGADTTFGKVTIGERLRLRIATAIALLRVGKKLGVGRHPGFLVVDSPGSQETDETNLEALLRELREVAEEEVGLQIFVSSAKAAEVTALLDRAKCRVIPKGEFVW